MFCMLKKKKYTLAIFQNIIQIVIPKEEKWNYPTVNKLSALLIEITSKHKGDFYQLNCLHFSEHESHKLESHKKVCENKYFCNVVMPSEDTKLLEFN